MWEEASGNARYECVRETETEALWVAQQEGGEELLYTLKAQAAIRLSDSRVESKKKRKQILSAAETMPYRYILCGRREQARKVVMCHLYVHQGITLRPTDM